MPTYKNIEVVITNSKGRVLSELGTRTNTRQQETSCYIESTAGQYFQVGVKPIGPFASREEGGEDWQLVATIRFDGRETPESATLLIVDKDHDYYPTPPDGRVMIGEKKVNINSQGTSPVSSSTLTHMSFHRSAVVTALFALIDGSSKTSASRACWKKSRSTRLKSAKKTSS